MFPSRSPYLRLSLLLGLFLPAFIGGLFLASNSSPDAPVTVSPSLDTTETVISEPTSSFIDASGRDVFKIVEQMPLFPGPCCGDLLNYKKRKKCADKAMLEYIYHHVRYPKRARDRNISGMAVVSFIVEPHGAITNVKVVRDPGGGLGEAAAKTVRKMRRNNLRWEPGLQKGKPVPVEFMLPVKFKLE